MTAGGTAGVRALKPGEPRIGSELQHAHEPRVAKDVEAVGNREDGTCPAARQHRTEVEGQTVRRTPDHWRTRPRSCRWMGDLCDNPVEGARQQPAGRHEMRLRKRSTHDGGGRLRRKPELHPHADSTPEQPRHARSGRDVPGKGQRPGIRVEGSGRDSSGPLHLSMRKGSEVRCSTRRSAHRAAP